MLPKRKGRQGEGPDLEGSGWLGLTEAGAPSTPRFQLGAAVLVQKE